MKIDYDKLANAVCDEMERRERMKQTFKVTLQAEVLKDFCIKCKCSPEFCKCNEERHWDQGLASTDALAEEDAFLTSVKKDWMHTISGGDSIFKSKKYNTEARVSNNPTYKCELCDNRIPITAKLLDWNICSECFAKAMTHHLDQQARRARSWC